MKTKEEVEGEGKEVKKRSSQFFQKEKETEKETETERHIPDC